MTSDAVLSRVLDAAMERALDEDRGEFGIDDLLDAITEDAEAAAAFASLGLDPQKRQPPEGEHRGDGGD